MLSRFFGKRDKPEGVPEKEVHSERGLEVNEADPDTAWSLWNNALAEQDQDTVAGELLPTLSDTSVESVTVNKSNPQPDAIDSRAPVRNFPVQGDDSMPFEKTMPAELVPLVEDGLEARRDEALAVVEQHHQRIANTIRTLWGYRECSVYINKLIMAGGDGMGHARVGFNQDAVQAMLALSDIHDAEFGPPDTLSGGLMPAL
jgi:hypothetical protein